jgi:chaperonin GroEL (HSP60 family)
MTNATSIANMVLITESLVADIPEKEKPQAAGMGGGMGDMGGMY